MRRGKCCHNKTGFYFAAFGFGMLISLICPNNVTIAVLSLLIVILGIIVSR